MDHVGVVLSLCGTQAFSWCSIVDGYLGPSNAQGPILSHSEREGGLARTLSLEHCL